MVYLFQIFSIVIVSAACCNQILAFRSKSFHAHWRFLQDKHQSQRFAYNDNVEGEFESFVQAATSEFTGVYGGDFAGLAATFNPGDGSFIPIPDYLIPDSIKEWGQEPKCLEVLVSEDIQYDVNNQEYMMARATTTILPDTGCAVDNLETMLAMDEIDLESQWKSDINDDEGLEDIIGLQYPLSEDKLRVETIFGLKEEFGVDRIRVAIDLIPSQDDFAIKSPMMLTLERQTNSMSSGGTIAKGGGLDGRTVYMLLGERLQNSVTFVDEPSMSYDTSFYNNNNFQMNDIRYVNLPANISIAYGWMQDENSWMLQVSHIINNSRRVISRQFTIANDGELDFEILSWVEDCIENAN